MENNFETPGGKLSPEELLKKNENKVRLLLEEHIDELSKLPQTSETIAEIQKYQAKLADHLNMLDKKYAVATDDGDAFSNAVRGTGEEAQAARMEARKNVSGGN